MHGRRGGCRREQTGQTPSPLTGQPIVTLKGSPISAEEKAPRRRHFHSGVELPSGPAAQGAGWAVCLVAAWPARASRNACSFVCHARLEERKSLSGLGALGNTCMAATAGVESLKSDQYCCESAGVALAATTKINAENVAPRITDALDSR